MPNVKIILDKDETQEEAENMLLKALTSHVNGDIHVKESFEDPAMIDAWNRLSKLHDDVYKDMIAEINDALDSEYQDGYK